jgi:hypothetical protein
MGKGKKSKNEGTGLRASQVKGKCLRRKYFASHLSRAINLRAEGGAPGRKEKERNYKAT